MPRNEQLRAPSDVMEMAFNGQNIAKVELEIAGSSRDEAIRGLLAEMQEILAHARRIGWEF